MNVSAAATMKEAGKAINDTFHKNVGAALAKSGSCADGIATIELAAGVEFDYVVSMEDMTMGARFGNYSVEFQRVGSPKWEMLVPPVQPVTPDQLRDRPDGHVSQASHHGLIVEDGTDPVACVARTRATPTSATSVSTSRSSRPQVWVLFG